VLLDHFVILREIEPPHAMSPENLYAAIEHLCKAATLLEECRQGMEEGVFDESLAKRLEDAWNEVNHCRVYTERILFIEELLIPVMGEINDAKCMFESLAAWNLGMTPAGFNSIRGCLSVALSGIQHCLEELASWMPGAEAEEVEPGDPQTP
jgi:hypothetical protein